MKSPGRSFRILVFLAMLTCSAVIFGQGGLLGSWKYVSQAGEMTMQIDATTIMINGQTFPYKAQGNVLMINEGPQNTPYPYMLDGNQLKIEFPGGAEIAFTRAVAGAPSQGQSQQSQPLQGQSQQGQPSQDQQKLYMGKAPGQQSQSLSGRWVFQNQQGQLVLEFLSSSQLSFNGETTQYQLKQDIIQAMGDYGWIDYPYTLSQNILTVTFPDGTKIPFNKAASSPMNQQSNTQQGMQQKQSAGAGQGAVWQLQGSLCSWSGSSNSYSSYSRTQRIVFDGQGRFQVGSETGFSSDAGLAYSGNPNVKTGTYTVGQNTVTLHYPDGDVYEFEIKIRADNGMITTLAYSGTLYAKELCE